MKYFEEAIKITKNQSLEDGYRSVVMGYGEMLMGYKKYQKAKEIFEEYLKMNTGDDEVLSLLRKCENVLEKVKKLGQTIERSI